MRRHSDATAATAYTQERKNGQEHSFPYQENGPLYLHQPGGSEGSYHRISSAYEEQTLNNHYLNQQTHYQLQPPGHQSTPVSRKEIPYAKYQGRRRSPAASNAIPSSDQPFRQRNNIPEEKTFLQRVECGRDGSCQFHSVATAAGIGKNGFELRNQLVDRISTDIELNNYFNELHASLKASGDPAYSTAKLKEVLNDREKYLNGLRDPKLIEGDQMVLSLLAKAFEKEYVFAVFHESAGANQIQLVSETFANDKRPVLVLYYKNDGGQSGHYQYLQSPSNKESWTINEILRITGYEKQGQLPSYLKVKQNVKLSPNEIHKDDLNILQSQ